MANKIEQINNQIMTLSDKIKNLKAKRENKAEQSKIQIVTLLDKIDNLKTKRQNKRHNCKHQFEVTHYHSLEDDEGNDAVEVAVRCELCGTFAECMGTLEYENAQGF